MRSRLPSLVAAALLAGAGCASWPTSWPIDPGDPVSLGEGQGLLVVHVHTNRPLRSIEIEGLQAAEDVPEGTLVSLIGITAGTYRWSEVAIKDSPNAVHSDTFRFRDNERLRFHVEPGVINYVGMIEVEREGRLSVWLNTLDRTAMAVEKLRQRYPDLLAKYPIVYSGPAANVFLERYRAAKANREHAQRDTGDGRAP